MATAIRADTSRNSLYLLIGRFTRISTDSLTLPPIQSHLAVTYFRYVSQLSLLLVGIGPTSRLPDFLAQEGDKKGVGRQVPAPEPARLAQEAIEPLQAPGAHDRRRADHHVCMEVERCTDTEEDRRCERGRGVVHPLFLFRGAEPYPDQFRTGLTNDLVMASLLVVGEGAVRRRQRSGHLEPRDLHAQPLHQSREHRLG